MITKIFYSLVLFPAIKYKENLQSWFFLETIYEQDFWLLKLIFKDKFQNEEVIFFQHKNFICKQEHKKIANWFIFWENKSLVLEIYTFLKKIDTARDFNFFDDKNFNKNRAFWVVLTITSKCNIFCYYCFNDIDYDLKTRNTKENLSFEFWKKTIDHLYENWTRVIILTGGEPMTAPFFWKLLDYLQKKNIFIHINTNWTLLTDKYLDKLNKNYSVNIMVSMHEFNDTDYYEVNKKWLEMTFWLHKVPEKFKIMFTEKVEQLRKINYLENISLEFLTILVWKNILNLEKIYEFWEKCWIEHHSWQFFRLYSTKNNVWATKSMMGLAVNKMYLLNKKYKVNYKIVDPVPFCVTKNIDRAREVIDWVLSDTHDVKTIITTEWYVQMMSAYDNNFWNIKDISIKEIFASEFVQKQLNNWFLPKECVDCKYKEECRGWSRMDANIIYGSYWKLDPLCNLENKVIV